ncbi:MAG TPA: HU family DNA-binding protein [Acholeplasmataceae bacterium]|jgi:nucleoid DNA-binding protein|nr:HU family DNA-binding protein [Acholeplasmataceae bacterium]
MKKVDIIELIHQKTGLYKKDIEPMLNALVDVMSEALSNGEKVQLTNFGTFEKKVQASYLGVHPITGEPMQVPPVVKVNFTSSSVLKRRLKEKEGK